MQELPEGNVTSDVDKLNYPSINSVSMSGFM